MREPRALTPRWRRTLAVLVGAVPLAPALLVATRPADTEVAMAAVAITVSCAILLMVLLSDPGHGDDGSWGGGGGGVGGGDDDPRGPVPPSDIDWDRFERDLRAYAAARDASERLAGSQSD